MLFVYGVLFAIFFLPVIVGREEGVGLGGDVINLGETETVGDGESLTVDRCTSDDVDILIRGAVLEGLLQRRKEFKCGIVLDFLSHFL